jgi:hypothetical protein
MAVKGYLQIKEDGGIYTLTRTGKGGEALSPEEQFAAGSLFGNQSSVLLRNENHTRISEAMQALKTWLKKTEYKTYFVTNGQYMIPAVVLSIVMVLSIIFTLSQIKMGLAVFLTAWVSLWSIGVTGLLSLSFHLWKTVLAGGNQTSGATMTQASFITLMSLGFLGAEIVGLVLLATSTSLVLVIALVASVFFNAIFHHLLRTPTQAGRGVLDKIEGFKRFLSAVDGDRLNRAMPPEKTPEMFEKFLPYALALDVEQAWAEKFSGVLNGAQASGQDASAYSPWWYSGSAWNSLGAGGFVGSLSNSFSGAISSSSTAPGSSGGGGGGGGGGSGGGGGGGGGGGW